MKNQIDSDARLISAGIMGAFSMGAYLMGWGEDEAVDELRENPGSSCIVEGEWHQNREKKGVEVRFDEVPPPEVREDLKEAGFIFASQGEYWFADATDETLALAQRLVGGAIEDEPNGTQERMIETPEDLAARSDDLTLEIVNHACQDALAPRHGSTPTVPEAADQLAESVADEIGVEVSEEEMLNVILSADLSGDAEERRAFYLAEPAPAGTEITFGKHSGNTIGEIAEEHPGYAEWAASALTDKPELAKGFSSALASTALPEEVEGEAVDLDLSHRVRGGGSLNDGITVVRALEGGYEMNDQRSKSGRSGSVSYDLEEGGVYKLRYETGSASNAQNRRRDTFYVAVRDGTTYRLIGGERAARAAAEGVAIT